MTPSATQDIVKLREQTGVGMMAAKRALDEAGGDMAKAVAVLRKAGEKIAASKVSRATREGAIGHYLHSNGKVASLVVVSCETDFVARSQPFQNLIHELAVHVAAANPAYVKSDEIPADVLEAERKIYLEQLVREKKPAKMREAIVTGKLKKFYAETCLLDQPFVKDDSMTVAELVQGAIQKLGENIQIRQFVRFAL